MEWKRVAAESPWGVRAKPLGGLMDGYFYIISGRAGAVTTYGDTWRSPDGVNWELMSNKTGWGKRCYSEVEIVRGNLVLMGGQGLFKFYNDVWRSADQGRTWQLVCAEAPWGVRAGHHTATIDDVIYLFAGHRANTGTVVAPNTARRARCGTGAARRGLKPGDTSTLTDRCRCTGGSTAGPRRRTGKPRLSDPAAGALYV